MSEFDRVNFLRSGISVESIVLAEDLFWPMAVKDNKLFAVVTRRGILASYDMGEEKWGHL